MLRVDGAFGRVESDALVAGDAVRGEIRRGQLLPRDEIEHVDTRGQVAEYGPAVGGRPPAANGSSWCATFDPEAVSKTASSERTAGAPDHELSGS